MSRKLQQYPLTFKDCLAALASWVAAVLMRMTRPFKQFM